MDRIEIIHPGEPVPASRPRLGRHGTYNDPKYTDYKIDLVASIGYFNRPSIPEPRVSKERQKYLKEHRYSLHVEVFRSKNRGDIDNFVKTVMDALQDAGIIANDSQIDEITASKHLDKGNPRVHFTLTRN